MLVLALPTANHAQCHLCSESSGNTKPLYRNMFMSICMSGRTLILGNCLCMSAAAVSAEDVLGIHACVWLRGRHMCARHCLATL